MAYRVYDLNPVDRITADAVGEPGKRIFYLQARKGRRLVTLLCEKEHVAILTYSIEHFLLSLVDGNADAVVEPDPAAPGQMELEVPLNPAFRVGEVTLGYDHVSERLVIIAYELVEEGQEGQEEQEERPSVARFWVSPAQARAFSLRARQVVEAGRPRCAMCGEPIDPEGHFCPRKNGHRQ